LGAVPIRARPGGAWRMPSLPLRGSGDRKRCTRPENSRSAGRNRTGRYTSGEPRREESRGCEAKRARRLRSEKGEMVARAVTMAAGAPASPSRRVRMSTPRSWPSPPRTGIVVNLARRRRRSRVQAPPRGPHVPLGRQPGASATSRVRTKHGNPAGTRAPRQPVSNPPADQFPDEPLDHRVVDLQPFGELASCHRTRGGQHQSDDAPLGSVQFDAYRECLEPRAGIVRTRSSSGRPSTTRNSGVDRPFTAFERALNYNETVLVDE
jgi:hypothetical protein